MSEKIYFINQLLSILTISAQVLIILFLIFIIFKKKFFNILNLLQNNSYLIAFIVALIATSGSLFYSEIAKFTPCILCWYQRILMYPQVILFFIALWKNEKNTVDYHLALSIIGGIIALYHYLLQIGVIPKFINCSTIGYSIDCAEKFTMNFGYITIPLMSFTAFALIVILMIINKIKLDKNIKIN